MDENPPTLITEADLPNGEEVLARGRALAKDWKVGQNPFLKHVDCPSEAGFKRQCIEQGRIMQHAQIGFRDFEKSRRAWDEIYETCQRHEVGVDRYGICLDWTMGLLSQDRDERWRGTGLILENIEEFIALTEGAPVAPHFGDFVLGFPASLENTQAALSAGSTAIGNLGQYFTFRLPGYEDDLAITKATLTALGLIAAQDVEVLIHSNLDDGFAAMFTDLSSSLGAVLIEKYIVEDLIGGHISHCYGHHFSNPRNRISFHLALAQIATSPGTMVYGNTTSYRGKPSENYASLAAYLSADIIAQNLRPSGHAINPVPVTENQRIPDIDEIIDAQLFAGRLIEHGPGLIGITDMRPAEAEASMIVEGGQKFFENTLRGFTQSGVDITDPFQMLLALRRLGGKRLEELYGAGKIDPSAWRGRRALVQSSLIEKADAAVQSHLCHVGETERTRLSKAGLKIMVASTDVHEHGKLLVERMFEELSVVTVDGGVSINPDLLAESAFRESPDALAISTYNGIALTYIRALTTALQNRGLDIPILIGGRLNQVPTGSNTSMPVDVTDELTGCGVIVCHNVEDAVPALQKIVNSKNNKGL